jgi:hypothetical protein
MALSGSPTPWASFNRSIEDSGIRANAIAQAEAGEQGLRERHLDVARRQIRETQLGAAFPSCPFLLPVYVDTARPYFLRAERLTSKRKECLESTDPFKTKERSPSLLE